jgi:hypothetical protein
MTPEQIAELEKELSKWGPWSSMATFERENFNTLMCLIAAGEERDLLVRTLQYPEHKAAFENLHLQREIARLKAERDELVKTLESIELESSMFRVDPPMSEEEYLDKFEWVASVCEEAIAKVQK